MRGREGEEMEEEGRGGRREGGRRDGREEEVRVTTMLTVLGYP